MIRELREADVNKGAEIWLDTNIKSHDFIPAQYWKRNFESVKEALLQAEVYVYEHNGEIQGFIGLSDAYVEGLFVSEEMQSQGIGKTLLDYAKGKKDELLLNVYQKNTRVIAFYRREGFEIQHNHKPNGNTHIQFGRHVFRRAFKRPGADCGDSGGSPYFFDAHGNLESFRRGRCKYLCAGAGQKRE